MHRFASRDHFASWNGTAPLDASSGQQQRHRLSCAGNRRINRTLHIMAIVQLRNPAEGRAYYDARKAAGKPRWSHAVPQTTPVQRGLAAHAPRPGQRAGDGSGRAFGDDTKIQRDRPDPGHRLFGQATSRTRCTPA
jgi:hypothetical protein